ncbi:unnamed protein product [Mycena citricolor]|uniref:Uncharacterized protein n=1 Tax=Mycena citricolor TaxID=2018698 RepID=A0AAD2H5E3_9AGAR|nr:unnamed protein product [Mycena citricolor]CAK5268863.1 unnamed protein product [Mycena citricolor]CAK5269040.1 unnamed protein product [Mycena citricolor]CAK5269041.1 unnamed protein product [Mycena citricolor]
MRTRQIWNIAVSTASTCFGGQARMDSERRSSKEAPPASKGSPSSRWTKRRWKRTQPTLCTRSLRSWKVNIRPSFDAQESGPRRFFFFRCSLL